MCRLAMEVYAFESPDLETSSRYLTHKLWTLENFLEAFEVEESIEKWENLNQISKFRDEFMKNPLKKCFS